MCCFSTRSCWPAKRRRSPRRDGRIATHAIGDRAVLAVLDAYDMIFDKDPVAVAANGARIEHGQVLSPGIIDRLGDSGVTVCIQPSFAVSDEEAAKRALGDERARRSYDWAGLLRAGVSVICGSDFPIESYDPLVGLRDLATGPGRSRLDLAGRVRTDDRRGGWCHDVVGRPSRNRRCGSIRRGSAGRESRLVPLVRDAPEQCARAAHACTGCVDEARHAPSQSPSRNHAGGRPRRIGGGADAVPRAHGCARDEAVRGGDRAPGVVQPKRRCVAVRRRRGNDNDGSPAARCVCPTRPASRRRTPRGRTPQIRAPSRSRSVSRSEHRSWANSTAQTSRGTHGTRRRPRATRRQSPEPSPSATCCSRATRTPRVSVSAVRAM